MNAVCHTRSCFRRVIVAISIVTLATATASVRAQQPVPQTTRNAESPRTLSSASGCTAEAAHASGCRDDHAEAERRTRMCAEGLIPRLSCEGEWAQRTEPRTLLERARTFREERLRRACEAGVAPARYCGGPFPPKPSPEEIEEETRRVCSQGLLPRNLCEQPAAQPQAGEPESDEPPASGR